MDLEQHTMLEKKMRVNKSAHRGGKTPPLPYAGYPPKQKVGVVSWNFPSGFIDQLEAQPPAAQDTNLKNKTWDSESDILSSVSWQAVFQLKRSRVSGSV